MIYSEQKDNFEVGLVGLQTHGLADRSIALDILTSIVKQSFHQLAFVKDASFESLEDIFSCITTREKLDLLAISLRPGSGSLMPQLTQALNERDKLGLSQPYLIIGGNTAQASPDILQQIFPKAFIIPDEAEVVFPQLLQLLPHSVHVANPKSILEQIDYTVLNNPFQMPDHLSTEQAIKAGGTIWIENSRGCQFNCTFCGLSNKRVNSIWRARKIEDTCDELEFIIKQWGINSFSFSDSSIFETEDTVKCFLRGVQQRQLSINFSCDMRFETANKLKPYWKELYNAGLRQIFTGIETLVHREQKLYHKQINSDYEIIRFLQSIGVNVVAGFITISPLTTKEELYQQTITLKETGILYIISTPLKTMRVYRGSKYEEICQRESVLGELNSDLLTYQYHCLDPYVEIIRQVIQFFDMTSKKVYFNFYIGNMSRLRLEHTREERVRTGVEKLSTISNLIQENDYWLLHELSKTMLSVRTIQEAKDKAYGIGLIFNKKREACFQKMAQEYDYLLKENFPYYREDLQGFIEKYEAVEKFSPEKIK